MKSYLILRAAYCGEDWKRSCLAVYYRPMTSGISSLLSQDRVTFSPDDGGGGGVVQPND
jgi:hypothetical protein